MVPVVSTELNAFGRVRGVDERSSARQSPLFLLLAYTPFRAKEIENLS